MADPFTPWMRLFGASMDMVKTARKAAETASASHQVVATRTGMMRAAAQSPLDGDYAELGRMLPEKVEAFSNAGSAMLTQWWAMQRTMLESTQAIGAAAMMGRPLTGGEILALGTRGLDAGVRLAEQGAKLGAGGIAPIHARATSNARRLKRKPR